MVTTWPLDLFYIVTRIIWGIGRPSKHPELSVTNNFCSMARLLILLDETAAIRDYLEGVNFATVYQIKAVGRHSHECQDTKFPKTKLPRALNCLSRLASSYSAFWYHLFTRVLFFFITPRSSSDGHVPTICGIRAGKLAFISLGINDHVTGWLLSMHIRNTSPF